jgi:hypothetical protein
MGTIPRPMIPLNPPTDPLEEYSKLLSVQRLQAGQQLQQSQIQNAQLDTQQKQLEVAQQQRDAQDQQTMRAQAPNYVQKDDSGKITGFDNDGYLNSLLGNGVSPTKVSAIRMQQAQTTKALADSGDAVIKLQDAKLDNAYNVLEGVRAIAKNPNAGPNTVQGAYQDALPKLTQLGFDTSKYPQNFSQVGDAGLQQFEAAIGAHKQIVADAKTQSETTKNLAEAGNAPTSPLGDKVPQLNDALTQRYQILHPGQDLPGPFKLQTNATRADFDRTDKILEATEKAQGTKAQQDTANAMREQTLALTKQTKDLTPVIGQDAQGNDVLAPQSEAQDMGLKNPMKAGEQEVAKAQAARHWIPLATAEGDPKNPDTMGILPLIDKLDKEGKLGVVASRWNDFLSGKVGAGDPDFTALRAKMGLSTTLLMNAHVGSRGGSYMLEHFQDLADAGKMDASTLRSGVKSELNYIEGRAMLPKGQQATTPTPNATQHFAGQSANGLPDGTTGTGSDKQRYIVKGGTWVAAQ